MLRQLLDSGKLTPSLANAVRELLDALATGQIGGLNQQQATWVEDMCGRCGIAVAARQKPYTARKAKQGEKERLMAEFDALPRPRKPPGKP